MKCVSLVTAGSIVVIANAFALIHAARNRMGSPEADITLTNRELRYPYRSSSDDDSGVSLQLEWTGPGGYLGARIENPAGWLDQPRLQSLGFDCSVKPDSPNAERFYQRQKARQVFVAAEEDGPAWRTWLESYELRMAKMRATTFFNNSTDSGRYNSHLVVIDADLDAPKLRARHPDRTNVVILPAVVAIMLISARSPVVPHEPQPARIQGRIQQLPSSVHLPRPFSDEFRYKYQPREGTLDNKDVTYRVHLRYGVLLEPWVTGVELTNPH